MLTISDNLLHHSNKAQRKNVVVFDIRSLTTKHKAKQRNTSMSRVWRDMATRR